MYVVGVSASFTDSLIYFTGIQELEGVYLEHKMLPERAQYSYQLKNYLESSEGVTGRTCFIYFSTNRKSLEKTITKIEGKYTKGSSNVAIRELDSTSFKFTKPEQD
ncbi:MAG: hypothetical protein ACRC8J_06365 [Phocaeicola sp.]